MSGQPWLTNRVLDLCVQNRATQPQCRSVRCEDEPVSVTVLFLNVYNSDGVFSSVLWFIRDLTVYRYINRLYQSGCW